MSNIFDEITSLDNDSVVEESVFMELATPDKIPQLKTIKRQVILPQGDPLGKGCIGFLYSKNLNESIKLMNNNAFLSKNRYKSYYYEPTYVGKIGVRTFRYKEIQERNDYYNELKEKTGYVGKLRIDHSNNVNIYYELFRYLQIFEDMCKNYQPLRYVETFWNFIGRNVILNVKNSNIVSEENKKGYSSFFVLADVSGFKISGSLKDDIRNPLYLLYYTVFKNPSLLADIDIPFYFYNGNKILVINPSLYVNKESALYDKDLKNHLKVEIGKMFNTAIVDVETELSDENIKVSEVKSNLVASYKKVYDNTSKNNSEEVSKLNKNIETKIDDTIKKVSAKEIETPNGTKIKVTELPSETISKIIDNTIQKDIDSDKELLKQMYYQSNNSKEMKKSAASTARDELLRKEQENIDIDGLTVSKLRKIDASNIKLETKDISNTITSTNDNIKKITFANMNKDYNKKLLKKDITDAFLSFNDKSIPMFVRDIKIEDTSDELNYKETYTVYLEDGNRKRHTVVVDIPKFIDNEFLYLGGNKKIIKNQSFYLPIVKIKPDIVEIVTNYSKMTMQRDNVKSTSYVERLKKLVNSNNSIRDLFTLGNAYVSNGEFITTVEYDDLAKNFVKFTNGKTIIFFDQNEATAYMKSHKIDIVDKKIFIGMDNGKPCFIDIENQESENGTIVDIIVNSLPEESQLLFDNVKTPKRLMFTKVKIMKQFITVGMLIGLWIGISKLLEALKVDYRLADNNKDVADDEEYIKFKDCYLIYKQTMYIALVMNGFRQFDTFNYEMKEFDEKIPYLNYLKKVYGSINIESALMNFYEFFIDPITKEVLEYLHMPTDIINVLLYAVKLLSDSQYKEDIDQSLSRIRCNEVIPAILYEKLAKNYITYKNFNGRRKFSIPRDTVIKELLGLKTVEDYSILNPTLEMYQIHSVSTKGFRGVNLDESYTPERRSYDPSMIGIISSSTSPDGSCGVNRNLALEPNIVNLRGIVEDKHNGKLDELKDVNLLSPAELTMPYAATIDDPNRLGHAVKQSSHVIPVKNSSPILISNGFEEAARFHLTSNFVINAEEDGEIIDYDQEANIMIARYKSGKCQAIDLSPVIAKNGGGGFFLSNKLETRYKVGDKFKKDSALAYHKDFFTNDRFNNCRMNMGTLTKVAIMSTYNTYEDATSITKKMSEDCASEMCFKKSAVIGKNSNVFYIVKKGQQISVGDPLIQFDTSFDDESLNMLLKNLSNDAKEQVFEDSKNEIKSKYSGVIEDIKIYSTVDLADMNETLRKIVSKYYKEINHKKEFLEKYDEASSSSIVKCGILMNETSHKIDPNKFGVIKGEKVNNDSVLIEFYIKHSEPLEVGSKIA